VLEAVGRPPATMIGPRLAAGVVVMARQRAGLRLDFTPRSVVLIDRMIDGMRRARPSNAPTPGEPAPRLHRALAGFGAYTGEVLVRTVGAAWVDFDAGQRDIFGQPFGVRTPDGRLWNPLGKAVKRFENGPEDSLRLFCLAASGRKQG